MSQNSFDKRPNEVESLVTSATQSKISKPQGKYKYLFKKTTHIFFHRSLLLFQTSANTSPKTKLSKTDVTNFSFDYYYKSYAIRKIESNYERNDSNKMENKSSIEALNPLPFFDFFQLDYNHYYIDLLKQYFLFQDSLLINNIYFFITYLEKIALFTNLSQAKYNYYDQYFFQTFNVNDETNKKKISTLFTLHYNKEVLNKYVLTFIIDVVIIINAISNSKREEKRREEKRREEKRNL